MQHEEDKDAKKTILQDIVETELLTPNKQEFDLAQINHSSGMFNLSHGGKSH